VKRSANITKEFLKDLPEPLINDIVFLIERHEVLPKAKTKQDAFTNSYNLYEAAKELFVADKPFSQSIHTYKDRGEDALKKKILFSIEGLEEEAKQQIRCFPYDKKTKQLIQERV